VSTVPLRSSDYRQTDRQSVGNMGSPETVEIDDNNWHRDSEYRVIYEGSDHE
jgi:hypothetical protein